MPQKSKGRNPRKGWSPRPFAWIVLVLVALAAATAAAVPAPLDTLGQASPTVGQADNGAGSVSGFSRTLLPEAKASTVPASRSPQRPPRLDDPVAGAWRYHLARQAALDGNTNSAAENLQAALEAAPAQPNYYWWQGLQALKNLDPGTFFRAMPASVRALAGSPLGRGQFVVAAQQAGILATGIFWTLLVVALYLARWRHLAHDAAALLIRNRAHHPLRLMPLGLPLIVLAFNPGWFAFLAILSVPVIIQSRGRDRWLLLGTWLVALALVFPSWPLMRQAVPTIDPASEVVLLDRACNQPPTEATTSELKERLKGAEDPARIRRLTVALGIQEARRGRYQESSQSFEQVLATEAGNLPARVGLANNTYYRGRLDAAVGIYQQAIADHPRCGEAYYNLAQAYFKKLFVPEATEALEQARKLSFDPGEGTSPRTDDGYAAVVYPGLTGEDFRQACRFEAGRYPAEVAFASWRPVLGLPPLPLYILVGAPLILALLVLMGRSGGRQPRECENCGLPVCRTCCKVRDNSYMCAACGEIAQRAQSDMILATLLKNRSRSEGMAYSQRIVRFGRFLPGTGHLASGRLAGGWLRLSLVAAGLFLAVAGWAFDPGATFAKPGLLLPAEMIKFPLIPLPTALWPGWTGLPILVGAAFLVLAWVMALLDGQNLRRGIPERHSLIPMTASKDPAPEYSHGLR